MHRLLIIAAAAVLLAACDDPAARAGDPVDMLPPDPDAEQDAFEGSGDADPDDDMRPVDPDDGVEADAAPDPDMAQVEPDMAPPEPDMAPPEPDMAPPEPDMAPPEPDMAPCVDDCDDDGFSVDEGDCADDDPERFPGQIEACDGVDQDCDGATDEGLSQQCFDGPDDQAQVGICRSGTSTCVDGAFGACEGQVLAGQEACEGALDEDCDGAVDEGCDVDGDGMAVDEGDCDDGDPNNFPGNEEVCDGQDNDCDQVVDGVREDCYDGPDGTSGVGICQGGERVCVAGVFGPCGGQVVPRDEACGDDVDDDCDGQADEGCDNPTCPALDFDAPSIVTISCVTAGSGAQSIVTARIQDVDGNLIPAADVQISGPPGVELGDLSANGTLYYRTVTAPDGPGEIEFAVSVGCGDGSRIALNARPTLTVAPAVVGDNALLTGGCSPVEGNLMVRVLDAGTGVPIEGAWVMVGGAPTNTWQTDAAASIRGEAGNASSVLRTDAAGEARALDFAEGLSGAQIVTAGAEGYENVTLIDVDASVATIPLRPVDPPPAPVALLQGTLTEFDDLSRDGQADIGLVLASFDLEFLSTLVLPRILSRYDCWDPATEGLAGNLVPETPVPGNLFAPQQPESLFGFPVTVEQHDFSLYRYPATPAGDQLMALAGKVPVDGIVNALLDGADLSALIQLLTPQEIGVLPGFAVDGDTAGIEVPLAQGLAANAGCDVVGLPADTGVLCFSVGDWQGGDGTGRLFPMGLASASPEQVDPVRAQGLALDVTTVPQVGPFGAIGYLGVALGVYLDAARVPEGRNAAVTAVFDRQTLGPDGGRMAFNGFFDTTGLARQDFAFTWTPVGTVDSPEVDMCRIEVVRQIRTVYDPGQCTDIDRVETYELPVWSAWVSGDPGGLSLPRIPGAWPRGASAGFIDVRDTAADDRLQMRISCYGLDGEPFAFDAGDFRAVTLDLSHISSNTVGF